MHSMRCRRRWLAAVSIAIAIGCGEVSNQPTTEPVSGKVSYKGQPVTKGTVTFQSADNRIATGQIQPDGTYSLGTFAERDGAIAGRHKVMIIANDGDTNLMPGSSPGYKPPKDLVPQKYQKTETSGLEATVAKGKNDIPFDLQ